MGRGGGGEGVARWPREERGRKGGRRRGCPGG